MRCCGIEVNPEDASTYNKLPVDAAMRSLIIAVHRSPSQYQARYDGAPVERYSLALERRSSAAPTTQPAWQFFRADDVARERLRLKLALLSRISG
jgi:hypothetical protein